MMNRRFISLTDDDLLRVEQIVIDRDKDGAMGFVKEVVKQQIDKENASKMKRERV